MKLTYKILLLFVFLGYYNSSAQKISSDTIYFDKKWDKTTRKNHKSYRLFPLKVGELSLVSDYYKDGTLQMQGYAYTDSLKVRVGYWYWYNRSGGYSSYSNYGSSITAKLKYFHHNGNLWKEVPYKNGKKDGQFWVYNNGNKKIYKKSYKLGKVTNGVIDYFDKRNKNENTTLKLYWFNSGKISKEEAYSNKGILSSKIYNEEGELIQEYKASDFIDLNGRKLKNGTFYSLRVKNGFVVNYKKEMHQGSDDRVVELSGIEYLGISQNSFKNVQFIKKKNDTLFNRLNYYINKERIFHLHDQGFYESYNKVQDFFFDIKDVKEQTTNQILESISDIEWSNIGETSKEGKEIFQRINSSYMVRYFENNRKTNVQYYNIRVVMFDKNKPVIMLSDGYSFSYFIVPLKKGGFHTNFFKNNSKAKTLSILEDEKLVKKQGTSELYNIIQKDGDNYIADKFNKILIDKPYNGIELSHNYIFAKGAKGFDIYNAKLDKLDLRKVRQYYYDRGNLQLLSNNMLLYCNSVGQTVEYSERKYFRCGTGMSSTSLTIDNSNKSNPKILKNRRRYRFGTINKKLDITNLKNVQDILFLSNKTDKVSYTSNSRNNYILNLLVVKNNNKSGLFFYDDENVKYQPIIEKKVIKKKSSSGLIFRPEPLDEKLEGKTKVTELLPIEYDEIKYHHPFIVVKKDSKYGIYRKDYKYGIYKSKSLIYKFLGQLNFNFMRYEKINGEVGWLDVHTMKHFPDL